MELTVLPHHDELVKRYKRGETAGYKELYQCYVKAMVNTCLGILNNIAEAEDVLHESFTEAFSNLHGLAYRISFRDCCNRISNLVALV